MGFEDKIGSTQESETPEVSIEQAQETPENREVELAKELEWQVGDIVVLVRGKMGDDHFGGHLRKSADGYYIQSGGNNEIKTELKLGDIDNIKRRSGVTAITLKEPTEK